MVRVGSLFSQLLKQIPRDTFYSLVRKFGAERYAKGFTSWTHLVAMLFSRLARADSLREICNGLACCEGKLVHVGIDGSPRRSTLAYANQHRPAAMFEALFWKVLERFREQGGLGGKQHPFRFKNPLLSLDSTTISLCLSLFPWAEFRQTKGGVKLHVLLNHDDYLPEFAVLTEARQHDLPPAPARDLAAGLDPGGRSRLHRLRPVRPVVQRGHLLGDPDEAGDRLHGRGVARPAPGPPHPGRRDHPAHRRRRRGQVPRPAAAHRRLGCRAAAPDRGADQPSRVRRHHPGCDLPRALADRALLQGAQAEPEGHDLRGHHRERPAYSTLDSSACAAAAQVAALPVHRRLVALQSGLVAAPQPLYLQGPARLAGQTARDAAPATALRAARSRAARCWTASGMSIGNGPAGQHGPGDRQRGNARQICRMTKSGNYPQTSTANGSRAGSRTLYFQQVRTASTPDSRRSWTAVIELDL